MTSVPSSELRDRIAAALEREDVNWGYDCGFSANLLRDDRTAAFVGAILATVQPELDRLRAELERTNADRAKLVDQLTSANNAQEQTDAWLPELLARITRANDHQEALLRKAQADLVRERAELEQARQQPPTDITIHSRKPGKWRFVDTETGQVWAWDVQRNTFKLADDATQPSA